MNPAYIVRDLGYEEIILLAVLAERRNCGKQPQGVANRRYDESQTDFALNYHGVLGEFAVGRLLNNAKVDRSVRAAGDDKVADLRYNGFTVQVKTNTFPYAPKRYLYFDRVDLFRADVAVLAYCPTPSSVAVTGWVTRDQFIAHHQSIDLKHGARVGMLESDLEPPRTLRQHLDAMTREERT